jgi:MFS family permease
MKSWQVRGLVFAAVMVVVRLIQGTLINAFQAQAGLISLALVLLFIVGPLLWGLLDGRADARANPDPDRRRDLALTWLLASLVAGILSGAVCWLLGLFYDGLYTGGLANEVTTFASFTALLVFIPATIGVAFGRWRVDRAAAAGGKPGAQGVVTDVFSAARTD